jgi:hypothetical protein
MANEIVPSGIGDLIAGEVLAAEYLLLNADRDLSFLAHPALLRATALNNTSNVVRVPHIGLGGYDTLSATTPGSEVGNTALADGSTDVTIATRAKRYNFDDLARFLIGGKVDPALLAQDLYLSVGNTVIGLLANVGDDFTTTAGSSGVDAAWTDIIDAKTSLSIAKVAGPLVALLHPRQWGDLEVDTFSLGFAPALEFGKLIGVGTDLYKGRYAGIDFFVSSAVPTADAGANRAGCVFGRGGMAWADAQMPAENDPNIVDLGTARLERVRQGQFVATSYVYSHHAGVAKAIDSCGVTLKTDA